MPVWLCCTRQCGVKASRFGHFFKTGPVLTIVKQGSNAGFRCLVVHLVRFCEIPVQGGGNGAEAQAVVNSS